MKMCREGLNNMLPQALAIVALIIVVFVGVLAMFMVCFGMLYTVSFYTRDTGLDRPLEWSDFKTKKFWKFALKSPLVIVGFTYDNNPR